MFNKVVYTNVSFLDYYYRLYYVEGRLIIREVLDNKSNKKRPAKKRPRQRWMDRIKDELKRLRNVTGI
jgi:hypothetical protein